MISTLSYIHEDVSHSSQIENLNASAFGPGRHVRAAARIREQGPHDLSLSFVCQKNDVIIGSVRMTPVVIGGLYGHMLGPLAVSKQHEKQGIGRKLVQLATDAAFEHESSFVILVGDAPYYAPQGFVPVRRGCVFFPNPVDPDRILVKLQDRQVLDHLKGEIKYSDC